MRRSLLRYFAYGSNMLRARLEARVGPVHSLGVGVLEDFRHSFTKLGKDGTGKGNISRAPGDRVYGVLYQLSQPQMIELARYEGGYFAITIPVFVGTPYPSEDGRKTDEWQSESSEPIQAHTYQALRPVQAMRPRDDYLDYYMRAMAEHGLPDAYRAMIRAQANVSDKSDDSR